MVVLYFVYGLVFFSTGVVLAFQARLPATVLSRRQLACLAAFALTHGSCEWTKMEQLASSSPGVAWGAMQAVLLVVSFTLLMQFGLEVLSSLSLVPAWTRFGPTALLLIAVVARVVVGDDVAPASTEAVTRYAFGLPGAGLAALALLAVDRERRRLDPARPSRLLLLAAGVFVAYALLGGAVVPRGTFFPASWLNSETFRATTGVRIEIARALCAFLVAVALTEAFVVERAKEHAAWELQREEFISVVAHDLRSPIGAIAMGVDTLEVLLARGDDLDVDRTSKVLRHIRSSATNLERMVSDLLDTSRIEAHRLSLQSEEVELGSLFQGVVARAAASTRGHPVKTLLQESLPAVEADPARVEQVLLNLLSNAAKYSEPGSEIRLEAFVRDAEVEVAVTNVGEGLAPEECARLFTRFYRSSAHRGRVKGLGLGLYIAKGLVEAHGGRMWVTSERGKYATFAFTLRSSAASGSPRPSEGAQRQSSC